MDDNYSTYRYDGFRPRRKPRVFLIVVIILLVSIAAGIAALYIGGFSFKDLKKGKAAAANTVMSPELIFWTVEVRDLGTKTEAINRAFSIKAKGGAGYIRSVDGKWTVVEGVYLTSADATRQMMGEDATAGAVTDKITVPAREITVPPDTADGARGIFAGIKTAFDTLVKKRDELAGGTVVADDIVLIANNLYTELKNKTAEITNRDDAAVTNIIYVANMDMLALYNLFISNRESNAFMSKLNDAVAVLTFSLTYL